MPTPGHPAPRDATSLTDVHVARWQAGDESAFEVLYQRFAPLLERRVRGNKLWKMLAGKHQVEDVVQEVWARVVPSARGSFTPSGPGSFLGYLGAIADRTMVDLVRAAAARKRGDGESVRSLDTRCERDGHPRPGLAEAETPTSRARASELEALARRVLSEREFEAWDLVELRDYTGPEAGLALDCSDSAVRGLLMRGRAKLVLALGGDGDGEGSERSATTRR